MCLHVGVCAMDCQAEHQDSMNCKLIYDQLYYDYKDAFQRLKDICHFIEQFAYDHNGGGGGEWAQLRYEFDYAEKSLAHLEACYESFPYKSSTIVSAIDPASLTDSAFLASSYTITSDGVASLVDFPATTTTISGNALELTSLDTINILDSADAFNSALGIKENSFDCYFNKLTDSEHDLLDYTNTGPINSTIDTSTLQCGAIHAAQQQQQQHRQAKSKARKEKRATLACNDSNCIKPNKSKAKQQSKTPKGASEQGSKRLRSNDNRTWYKCAWEGCSFGSYYNGVVKRHSYKRHSGKMKIDKSSNSSMHRFKCDWPSCEVSLVAYHKLVEHKRKHTGEKPFRCKWKSCNYATARLYSMIIHERTHKLEAALRE